jgi:hypothetical protein
MIGRTVHQAGDRVLHHALLLGEQPAHVEEVDRIQGAAGRLAGLRVGG